MTVSELLESALSLSPTDRVALIEQIYRSFSPDYSNTVDQKWVEECDSRMQAIENGEMSTSSAADVFSRLNES